jgi:hypothetical protein
MKRPSFDSIINSRNIKLLVALVYIALCIYIGVLIYTAEADRAEKEAEVAAKKAAAENPQSIEAITSNFSEALTKIISVQEKLTKLAADATTAAEKEFVVDSANTSTENDTDKDVHDKIKPLYTIIAEATSAANSEIQGDLVILKKKVTEALNSIKVLNNPETAETAIDLDNLAEAFRMFPARNSAKVANPGYLPQINHRERFTTDGITDLERHYTYDNKIIPREYSLYD